MYKICKTDQSVARQRDIELGLLSMMCEQPYESITVSDLCDRLHIPRKAFYRYFIGKEGALIALIDHTMLEFYTSSRPGPGSTAITDLKEFFLFWYDRRQLLEALDRSGLSGMMVERASVLALQEKLMPRTILSMEEDLQGIAMAFAVSGLMGMVIRWHHSGYATTAERLTQAAVDMLTKPLLQEPRLPPHRHGG